MMGMMGGGVCSDGGMFSLAETHSEKSEPAVTEQLETPAEVVEPVLEATSPIVHSTSKESSPGVLIALASGSFFRWFDLHFYYCTLSTKTTSSGRIRLQLYSRSRYR